MTFTLLAPDEVATAERAARDEWVRVAEASSKFAQLDQETLDRWWKTTALVPH